MFLRYFQRLDKNVTKWEVLEKYFGFLNKNEELSAKEFDSKYDDNRDFIQKEKTDFINNKINMLAIHKKLQKLDLNKVMMDFDATSLYLSAMYDEK